MNDIVCTLALLRRDDQILLAMKKRGMGAGYWNGPGGKIEPGESVEQAMIRECQEEVGITPTSYHQVAIHDFVLQNNSGSWHQYAHVYMVSSWEGTARESDEMRPEWFALSDIPYEQMWADDILWLPQVLEGKKLATTFQFNPDETVKSHLLTEVESF